MTAAPIPSPIRAAADWLSRQPAPPSPVVPTLRRQFALTTIEAIEAIRLHQSEGPQHVRA